jgi:hypothetical protein
MSYAVVNYVRLINPAIAADATRNVVLPRLKELSGYEHAIFLADENRQTGFSVMVFATKESAKDMADRLGSGQVPSPPGIAFERQEVWEVVASG